MKMSTIESREIADEMIELGKKLTTDDVIDIVRVGKMLIQTANIKFYIVVLCNFAFLMILLLDAVTGDIKVSNLTAAAYAIAASGWTVLAQVHTQRCIKSIEKISANVVVCYAFKEYCTNNSIEMYDIIKLPLTIQSDKVRPIITRINKAALLK